MKLPFKLPFTTIFTLALLFSICTLSSCATLQTPETVNEINENDLLNLIIADKPSVVLFYSPDSESNYPLIISEYEKLPQLVTSTGLEINIVKYKVQDLDSSPQGFVIRELPSIKLIIEGSSFEYAGEKKALSLLKHVKERFMQGLLTVSSKQNLDILLQSEKTVLVYFTTSDFCGMDSTGDSRIIFIKRSLEILAKRWSDIVTFVLAKDVTEVSSIEGFQAPTEGLMLFRKHSPMYVFYTQEDIEPETVYKFLLENAFSKVTELDRKLYEFFKKEKLAILLLIVQNEDDSQLAEDLVNVSKDLGHDLIVTLHWNEEDKDGTKRMLQNLIGSGKPFEQSQVFILDYGTGSLKFYRLDTSINEESIKSFYQYWKDGLLKPLLRSEIIPPFSESEEVQKIVGRNYLSKVMDLQNDAFVLFYFDGCGETCVKMLQMIESLAAKLSPLRVLKFYRINLSLNDVPGLQIKYLPAFGGYPIKDKTLRLFEADQISYDKVLDFIHHTTDMMTAEQYKKVKGDVDAMYFDAILEDSNRKRTWTVSDDL